MGMAHLEELWPDPDRRDDALERLNARVHVQPDPAAVITPAETRVLECLSHGLGRQGTADAVGVTLETVKTELKGARRRLRAKDTTHAVAEALRRGLIR